MTADEQNYSHSCPVGMEREPSFILGLLCSKVDSPVKITGVLNVVPDSENTWASESSSYEQAYTSFLQDTGKGL